MRGIRWAFVLLAAVAGCADPLADACGGTRPELDACPRGLYFAECGGEPTPTLACSADGCLWFSGTCIATGFRPTECPLENACCRSTSSGPWPYADGFAGSFDVRHELAVLGAHPVTRDEAALGVAVDRSITDPGAVAVACDADLDLEICFGRVAYRSARRAGGGWVLEIAAGYPYGELTQIEVRPTSDGSLRAHLYVSAYTDVGDTVATCDGAGTSRTPEPQSGTVTISTSDFDDPLAVHGEGVIQLEGRGALRLRF